MKKNNNIIQNRKARYNFEIIEKLEAGIVLKGSEIKAIRMGTVALDSSYAGEKNGEIWVFNLHINSLSFANKKDSSEDTRPRKLLLKKKEITKLSQKLKNDGYTIVPLDIHFNKSGFAKLQLGLSKGRKKADLRQYKKEQDWKRTKERIAKIK